MGSSSALFGGWATTAKKPSAGKSSTGTAPKKTSGSGFSAAFGGGGSDSDN